MELGGFGHLILSKLAENPTEITPPSGARYKPLVTGYSTIEMDPHLLRLSIDNPALPHHANALRVTSSTVTSLVPRGALQVRLALNFDYSRALFGVSGRTPCDKQLSGVIKYVSINNDG